MERSCDSAEEWKKFASPANDGAISRNILPALADGYFVDPLPDPPDELDDDTERFALQACPHCAAITAVALCLASTLCEVCGERFEVAPLLA